MHNIDALTLARYIVQKAAHDKHPFSNLHLQIILFIIQKYFAARDFQGINDCFYAWQFGPVIPRVFYRFAGHGALPIYTYNFINSEIEILPLDEYHIAVIDEIIKCNYGLHRYIVLPLACPKGGAWETVYDNGNGECLIIPRELITQEAKRNIGKVKI